MSAWFLDSELSTCSVYSVFRLGVQALGFLQIPSSMVLGWYL